MRGESGVGYGWRWMGRKGGQVELAAMGKGARTWLPDLNSTQKQVKSIPSNVHSSLVRIAQAFQLSSLLLHGPLSCRQNAQLPFPAEFRVSLALGLL